MSSWGVPPFEEEEKEVWLSFLFFFFLFFVFFVFFVFWVKLNFLLDSCCGFVWFGWKWLWEGSVGVQGFGLCFLMSFRWWVQFGVLCFCLVLMEMVLGFLILIFVEIMFFIIIIIIWNGGGDFIWFGFKWL